MKGFAHFFIDRPRFATVISLIIVFLGGLSYFGLPVAQFPEVAPPTVVVRTSYPGATPDVIAKTVAAPIEQEINGVENMLYMNSQSTSDGSYALTITFDLGTDLDTAQVLVQNRVAIAQPRLPQEVQRIGVVVQKSSPDLLMVVQMLSPDTSFDLLYVSNYALLQVRENLRRINGVGDVRVFGGREYSMRVWLDPARMDFYELTTTEVVAALREQNLQVAAGLIGQAPLETSVPFQINLTTLGRLESEEQFEDIVVKSTDDRRIVRLKDVARVELGALDYSVNAYLNKTETVGIPIFQQPGSNALATAQAIRDAMDEMSQDFPEGLEYAIVYDPTVFISDSIEAVMKTLLEAVLLVMIVMLVFLQSWRAAIIPVIAIPVSLIGTFAVMAAFGFSVNTLTLFGLVLAIGIVVDDAIVVVENMERNLEDGLSPREAARKSMAEVSGALVASALVLLAVFIPTAFLGGISGQFYRQFGVTIATSTTISALVSLSLSPALGVLLLRSKEETRDWLSRILNLLFGWFFKAFNWTFNKANGGYTFIVGKSMRVAFLMIILYLGLLGLAGFGFMKVPGGFIPPQDQGYAIIAAQLPTGASLERSDAVAHELLEIVSSIDGIEGVVGFSGFNGATFSVASNAVVLFPVFEPFDKRHAKKRSGDDIIADLTQQVGAVGDAITVVIPPPSVRGVGNGGGFKMEIQDRAGLGYNALEQATWNLIFASMNEPEFLQNFTPFTANGPQYYAEIDREKALMLGIPLRNVFETLEVYLGSSFVNEMNLYGRTYRVTAQADSSYRDSVEDIHSLTTRNSQGGMVPLGSVLEIEQTTGPDRVVRHNLYPAADLIGTPRPGFSTGEALDKMELLADQALPEGISYEWVELAYQERAAGNTGLIVFPLAILFVFLLLTAQYENWGMPLAVILTVPLCLVGAIWGVWLRGMDNNILTQIGLVVLVALASKNAILIVEFARQLEDRGMDRFEAAKEAAHLRLRPIMMTAFAFILGVVPLVIASGAGAEMRQALGTAVFFGMIAVTMIGVFFAPVFYAMVRRTANRSEHSPSTSSHSSP